MIIGFTGTREGMTPAQKKAVEELLAGVRPREFHHGDCIGADEEAHGVAARLAIPVHGHPPDKDTHRAYCACVVMHDPKPYQARNMDIVRACDTLVATPQGFTEELRSGTWSTVRKALGAGKPVLIIWPDGNQERRVK